MVKSMFSLAQQISNSKKWRLYLSQDEGRVLEKLVTSNHLFDQIMSDPSKLFEFQELSDIFDQDTNSNKAAEVASRIRSMIWDQHIDSLFPLDEYTLQEIEKLAHEIEQKEDGLDTQVDDVSSLIPIEDLYFSLEYDAELIPKLHLFDREREEVKEDQNDVEETVQVVEETIDAPNGLKYLLQHVKKQSANVNMKFIKKILNEAIPSKSKWANDGRVGQEQLYEALEKVLVALKNYTEHSLPFLKPVQKRDAPNYYLLIKNPMDLSTMSKKLKNVSYNSKSEFVRDLELIWSNCLEYNTIPESIYRKHAFAMKKRAGELLEKVPEIQVQNASEVDELESQLDRDVSVDPSVQSILTDQQPLVQSIPVIDEEMSLEQSGNEIMESMPSMDSVSQKDGMDIDEPQLQEMQEDVTFDSCVFTRKWKEVTTDFRASKLQKMQNERNLPFGERQAILRNEKEMDSYALSVHNSKVRMALRHLKFDLESNISLPEESSFCFPELFHPAATFPQSYIGYPKFYDTLDSFFSWQDQDERSIPIAPLPSLSEYDQSYVSTSSKLASCMSNNITELKLIKEVHSKILQHQNPSVDSIPAVPVPDPLPRTWKQEDLPPFILDEETALQLVNKSCGWILAHQGFDGASSLALATLSDIMIQLLMTAGKTIKAFSDQFGNELNMEEITIHSLEELGIQDPIELQHYINHDVIRYGRKLRDLRRRLEFGWNDVGNMKPNEEVEVDFDNQNDKFVTGNIFEEVGIDVLNLKELGLDVGFIPASLLKQKVDGPLQARIKKSFLPNTDEGNDSSQLLAKVDPPMAWNSVDPSSQIGLLQPFYNTLQMVPDAMIEDEAKPKSKEAKLMIKYAISGARKRPTQTAPKKKITGDGTKISIKTKKVLIKKEKAPKKERKKK